MVPASLLKAFGVFPDAFLGNGNEASVFALDDARVLRVGHPGATAESYAERSALLDTLARTADRLPFAIPRCLETLEVDGRQVAIETRLSGKPMATALNEATGSARRAMVRRYLDAADQIGNLVLERPWFGDLFGANAVRSTDWRAYLQGRAERSLRSAHLTVDAAALAADLPDLERAAFVHMDVFPGNVLVDGDRVCAIIDFGTSSMVGDRRLEPIAAAAYLATPITPNATEDDRRIAREWLEERGYGPLFAPMQRWLAAYWAFATDDTALFGWVCETLSVQPGDRVQ